MNEPTKTAEDIGRKLFTLRDYTPIPLILLLLTIKDPTIFTTVCGMLSIFAGELIRVYSVSFIGGISRTRSSSLGEMLVVSGPFRFVRNPLYVGNFFITIGFGLISGKPWFLLLSAAVFALQYHFIVQYEETLLQAKFGDEYDLYLQKVPGWIPETMPTLESLEWPESFSHALRSEKRTLGAMLLVLLLVIL